MIYYRITETPHQGNTESYTVTHDKYLKLAADERGRYHGHYDDNVTADSLEATYGDDWREEAPEELVAIIDAHGRAVEVDCTSDGSNPRYYAPADAPSKLAWADEVFGHDLREFRREEISFDEYAAV